MAKEQYTLTNKYQSETTIKTLNKHITDLELLNEAEHNNVINLVPSIHPQHKLTKIDWSAIFIKSGWASDGMLSDRYTSSDGSKSSTYEQYSAMYDVNANAKLTATLMSSKVKQLEDDSRNLNDGTDNIMSDKHLTFTEALFILSGLNPISLQKTIKMGSSPNDEIIEHLISETDTARALKKCNNFQGEMILTKDFITWAVNSNLLIKRNPSQADTAKQIIERSIISFLESKTRAFNLNELANHSGVIKELPSPPGKQPSNKYSEKQITTFIKNIYPNLPKDIQNLITWSPKLKGKQ